MFRTTTISIASLCLAAAMTSSHAQPAKAMESPFAMECASASVKFMPRGNAAVGSIKFKVAVDPAAKKISVEGDDRPGAFSKYEVWFKTPDGQVVSISRSTGTFRYLAPIKGGTDSRLYLLFEGACKTI